MSEITAPEVLRCSIVAVDPSFSSPNYTYVVTDKHGIVVATGVSSSPEFVRHEAGGYHTKQNFDSKFPHGWTVVFDFN
jgi:hypothetical protein